MSPYRYRTRVLIRRIPVAAGAGHFRSDVHRQRLSSRAHKVPRCRGVEDALHIIDSGIGDIDICTQMGKIATRKVEHGQNLRCPAIRDNDFFTTSAGSFENCWTRRPDMGTGTTSLGMHDRSRIHECGCGIKTEKRRSTLRKRSRHAKRLQTVIQKIVTALTTTFPPTHTHARNEKNTVKTISYLHLELRRTHPNPNPPRRRRYAHR